MLFPQERLGIIQKVVDGVWPPVASQPATNMRMANELVCCRKHRCLAGRCGEGVLAAKLENMEDTGKTLFEVTHCEISKCLYHYSLPAGDMCNVSLRA